MSRRDILGNKELFGEEPDPDRKEYTPPEDRDIQLELLNLFTILKHEEPYFWWKSFFEIGEFESEVETLESMMEPIVRNGRDKVNPQSLIDALTDMIRHEFGSEYSKPQYLTAVVQALYNLDYNDFTIDIRGWPGKEYTVGQFLRGRPDRPLTLSVYGNFRWCGDKAKYCNFDIQGNVYSCGSWAKHSTFIVQAEVEECGCGAENSNFTLHDKVKECGKFAKHSSFTLHGEVEECGEYAKDSSFISYNIVGTCAGHAKNCSFVFHDKVNNCGEMADYCSFTFHDEVNNCGRLADYCNFTFHDWVGECGSYARNCRFDLMPDAEIEQYLTYPLLGNRLRRLDDKGEVMIIPTIELNLQHALDLVRYR